MIVHHASNRAATASRSSALQWIGRFRILASKGDGMTTAADLIWLSLPVWQDNIGAAPA